MGGSSHNGLKFMETLANQRQVVPGEPTVSVEYPCDPVRPRRVEEPVPPGGATPGTPAEEPLLADWKVIGRYLRNSIRTVQRWERKLGLPVRRLHNGSKSGVFAVRAELAAWLQVQKFRDESLSFGKSEKTLLLHTLEDLRQENQDPRRQLEAERAKR
jgi:hypothetical protein